jgi:uncharacterized UPF0160 family protein
MESKKLKLVTHDGSFHADDIFATATLSILLEKNGVEFEVIRTRESEIINSADYVYDVGGVHDEATNRFDHHQVGGAGKRKFGEGDKVVDIEYAAFGLVWKKFGKEVAGSQKAADIIEKKLVAAIDAGDNGFEVGKYEYDVTPYSIQSAFYSMRPTWKEEGVTDDEMFFKCVPFAKEVLLREVKQISDFLEAEEKMDFLYKNSEDKRIVVLDQSYPYEYFVQNLPEPLFVVLPSRDKKDKWSARAVRQDPKTFKNRKDFPKAWAGLRDEELQQVSGVPDAIFCHRALFLAVAKTKEGAIELAKKALEATS